ncbi:MAG: hypothetical protein IPI67_40045 [Myxococcales bacterium]|nr:hypothetical protein [Myxococcales bacterium]
MRAIAVLAALLFLAGAARAEPTARFPDPGQARAAPPPAPAELRKPANEPWGRSTAREHLRRASEHLRRGDTALALGELNEATRMDPSFGEAYLELGRVRELSRDFAEADRVYAAAARIPSARADALFGQARVARVLGRHADAFRALEGAVELAPERKRVQLLAEWYVERRAWPAALVAWRRVLSLLDDEQGPERDVARLRVRALVVLAAEADPVVAGASHHGSWVRRSLAQIGKKPR